MNSSAGTVHPILTATPWVLSRRTVEASLTAATLLGLVGSLLSEYLGAQAGVVLALNLLAYAAGGGIALRDAFATLRSGKLDVNVLMIGAAVGAAIIDQWHEGATLLFLFALSNTLQGYAMDRSRRAIQQLIKLRPTEAHLLEDGRERVVPLDVLRPGQLVLVRPGELVPTDGTIRRGQSALMEASITGESLPVDKKPDDAVFAGTLNGSGAIEIEVLRPASDSTLARIIELVESAQAQKARSQRFLERFEGYYAGVVILAAATVAAIPALMGMDAAAWFHRAMVLLVVASPCALVISTPAAYLSAIANGARNGVLIKGGIHLERLASVQCVALDKTGTLTEGRLHVTDVTPMQGGATEEARRELLTLAAALEERSEHPIARAVVEAAAVANAARPQVDAFLALPGRGVQGAIDGQLYWLGSERLFREHGEPIPAAVRAEQERLEDQGKTVLVLHRELARSGDKGVHESGGGWMGVIAVADVLRPLAAGTVAQIRKVGAAHVVMLTGDNARVASALGRKAGIHEIHAGLLPDEKVKHLRRLREKYGSVLMVGDGVNDAPALAAADVGVAMGAAGSDVALETADVVLMSDRIQNLAFALRLGRKARRIVLQNLVFALLVILVLIVSVFAWELPMPAGVVGHEGSTLLVVANGLRLLALRREE